MRRVHSSSIAAVGYDRGMRTLRVRFINGGVYDYLQVPTDVFQDLLDASSKGQFVNWQIKPCYPYVRLTDNPMVSAR